MRLISGLIAGAALALAAPAFAQAITTGMQVVDPKGGAVGTVTAVEGDIIKVKTDKHEVPLAKGSFAVSEGKAYFGMTQVELNDAVQKSLDAANAAVAAGATVKGAAGTEIGKIESLTETDVVITLPSGKKIQIAKSGVRGNPDGTVTTGLTAEQIEAATKGGETAPKGK